MQVGFVAGRDLEAAGLDLGEVLGLKPIADGGLDAPPGKEERAAIRVPVWHPPGENSAHVFPDFLGSWRAMRGAEPPHLAFS